MEGEVRPDKMLEEVYAELHRLARSLFSRERPDHTLQATALVHEAYLRLSGTNPRAYQDRVHFYCVAARAMRRILVNHARDRKRLKRGGDHRRIGLEDDLVVSEEHPAELLALDEALGALAAIDSRKARIVELRYFAGLSVIEVSELLGLSKSTVKAQWALARAWLYERLAVEQGDGG